MSRNFVLLLATIFISAAIFCAAVSAQTSVTYHIWNTDNLPNSSTIEKYYRYLSRPDDAPTNQLGLYQVVPTLGGNGGYYISDDDGYYVYYGADNQSEIVLHNDDSTLKNQTFGIGGYYYYYDDYYYEDINRTTVTVQSDTLGVLRTMTATNAPLFNVWNNAQLTISSDIIVSKKEDEGSSTGYYGAIYLQSGQLNAQNVLFSSCLGIYNNSYGGAITSYGYYDYYGVNSVINVDGARFIGNKANSGGAIYLYQNNILNGNRTVFDGNSANRYGGALSLYNSTATLENATFTNNTVDYGSGYGYNYYGGAIYAANSNLYLKGTNFTSNNAAGLGGAIYFEINDSGSYALELGAFQGTSVEFAGNKQNYDSINYTGNANSITFTSSATGIVNVAVDVEGNNNNFNMRDPMAVYGGNLRFTKSGEGAWNLYGISNLSYASGVLFNIDRGTFRLGDNAELYMTGG
ncbi:MAG: hypothetical protein LBK82_09205, partial [Planctomycetaceae bacterium]|nr:hypothetical protein [Planctomycetaceae bacterium]